MTRKLKGQRIRNGSWEVNVRVNGKLYTTTFPLTTPVEDRRQWREDQLEQHGGDSGTTVAGSITEDVQAYEPTHAAMPTIKQRMAHLWVWVAALGGQRPSNSVTSVEIEGVMQEWLTGGLAPATVRKRRTALLSFYKWLRGPKGKNPVRGTPIPAGSDTSDDEPRAIDYGAIERAIAEMPEQRDTKKGLPPRVSLSKLRARVLAYTGLPPGMLKKVLPSDLSLTEATLRVSRRKKGKGVEVRTIRLAADALAAFRAFHAGHAYGPFATQSLNVSFKRGCKRAGLDPTTVWLYVLRHSFLTQLYRVTRDEATVGRLGLHAPGSKMTARYTKAAHEDVDAAAVADFGTSLSLQRQQGLKPAPPVPTSPEQLAKQLAAKVGGARKSSRDTRLRAVK